MRVEYAGIDRETNSVVWLGLFADEPDRVARKGRLDGSEWWLEREAEIMDHVLEYEVTFLEAWRVHDGTVTAAPPESGTARGRSSTGHPTAGRARCARRSRHSPVRPSRDKFPLPPEVGGASRGPPDSRTDRA